MILSMFFLFLMLLLITAAIFYLFCFFLPALKMKYEGLSDTLSSDLNFRDLKPDSDVNPDFSKIAAVNSSLPESEEKRFSYKGEKNCRLFHKIYGYEYKNPRICIGFGDCVTICPQKAISIKKGIAEISETCNGCGKCLSYCPLNIISLVPREKNSSDNSEKGFKFLSFCYKLFFGGMKGC